MKKIKMNSATVNYQKAQQDAAYGKQRTEYLKERVIPKLQEHLDWFESEFNAFLSGELDESYSTYIHSVYETLGSISKELSKLEVDTNMKRKSIDLQQEVSKS